MTWAAILADDTPIPAWANYGVLGLLVLAFITRQIVSGLELREIKRERDDERAENRRLAQVVIDTHAATTPALERASVAVKDAMDELSRIRRGDR